MKPWWNRYLIVRDGKKYSLRVAWTPTVQWRCRFNRHGIYLGLVSLWVVIFTLDLGRLAIHVARRIG